MVIFLSPMFMSPISMRAMRLSLILTQEDAQRLSTKSTVHPVVDVAEFSTDEEHSAQDVTESFDDLEVLDSLATQMQWRRLRPRSPGA